MGKTKQQANAQIRIYQPTRKRPKIRAAQLGISLAELLDSFRRPAQHGRIRKKIEHLDRAIDQEITW